jgi:hypothetical protein
MQAVRNDGTEVPPAAVDDEAARAADSALVQ